MCGKSTNETSIRAIKNSSDRDECKNELSPQKKGSLSNVLLKPSMELDRIYPEDQKNKTKQKKRMRIPMKVDS